MLDYDLRIFDDIIEEMKKVYKHDKRSWMIGFSGGKDSTLLCYLVFEMLESLEEEERNKSIYIVSSDTMVENPIVRDYMEEASERIGEYGKKLNIESRIIYPEVQDTFWTKVIGLGYLTPEAPGFRWCTQRLKIKPMNAFTLETISKEGEIVLLLGVRKDESTYRKNNISNREIQGKLLIPHTDIKNAFVYNPLVEIKNDVIWEYLLKDKGVSPWGTNMNYLAALYEGEVMGEEQSVIGQLDEQRIPVTGNSRFGCWICTLVKEDKSLKRFIEAGEEELIPLRDFRNKLLSLRNTMEAREPKRRNGAVYVTKTGAKGYGPFTMETRKLILKELLELEELTGYKLITIEELKFIDKLWEQEGDLTRKELVNIYKEVKGDELYWSNMRKPVYSKEVIDDIKNLCKSNDIEFELISKLIIGIDNNKNFINQSKLHKDFDRIINEGWLHNEYIQEGIKKYEN